MSLSIILFQVFFFVSSSYFCASLQAIQPVTDSIFSSGEQKKGDTMELDPLRSDYDYVTPTD